MSRRGSDSIYRVEVPECGALVALLEITEDSVWLSRTIQCRRATVRGVPGKRIDAIVEMGLSSGPAIVEISEKEGRYGGSRPRICVRRCNPSIWTDVGEVSCIWSQARCSITLTRSAGDPWEWSDVPLRTEMHDYSPARLISWHWTRYYHHLSWVECRDLADTFCLASGLTLAEANRLASRELYSLSRQLGWRKLTLREQGKLGLTGQWHRAEVCGERAAAGRYPRDGVSDASHDAARSAEELVW